MVKQNGQTQIFSNSDDLVDNAELLSDAAVRLLDSSMHCDLPGYVYQIIIRHFTRLGAKSSNVEANIYYSDTTNVAR